MFKKAKGEDNLELIINTSLATHKIDITTWEDIARIIPLLLKLKEEDNKWRG